MESSTLSFEDFARASDYSSVVGRKKLRFIYAAVHRYARQRKKRADCLRVLEIGCGTGSIVFPLAKLGCTVDAYDINPLRVEEVRERADTEKIENVSVSVAPGEDLNVSAPYDIVILSEVLQYAPDTRAMIRRCRAAMTKDSHLIVTIPNGYGPWELKNRLSLFRCLRVSRWGWLRSLLGKAPFVELPWEKRLHFFTWEQFTALMTKESFQCEDSASSDFILPVLPLLGRVAFLAQLDAAAADLLPRRLASGWFFVFSHRRQPP
jgi:SAM-dependent methyltransferase